MATLVMPVESAGAAPAAPDSARPSEAQRALEAATKSGQRVEVTGERSERSTVFANPDGFSFTLEESSVPVRVAKPGGGWQTPDATLVRRADGSVGPRAAAAEMSFSPGGDDDPLVSIADKGRALELSWPGKLPGPELDGPSALYREVLAGVDLKVTATVEGFQHVLVVKTPKAAGNPKLKKLTFGLKARGLSVVKNAVGALAAVDTTGQTVFRAPPAQMWNSAGKKAAAELRKRAATRPSGSADTPRSGTGPQVGRRATVPADASEAAPSGAGTEPGQGDRVARMGVKVTKNSLAVVPDPAMLSGTDAAAFPLFIDPTVTWGESERTLLRSDGYESYGWSNGDDGLGKGMGKCGTWNGYYCGPGYVQRLYFEFSPASLKGKQVLDATFRVTEPWAFQCEPRWVDLVRTNNISSSTTWASRPKELDWMVDRHVSAGRGSLCDPDSPDAPIEFNDNPAEPNENLTPTVKDFAAGKFSRLTLQLRAHDESDTSAWKRFKNDAVLAVDFVGIPDKPTSIGLVAGTGTVCSTDESSPSMVSDPTPALTATTQTKPGGESGAQLRIIYDLDHKNSDGTWSDTPPGNGEMKPSTGYAGDGSKQTLSWSTLAEGKLYRYRAWTRSYYNNGGSHLSGPSNASTTGWCHFKVDPTAPKAPTVTVGSPYSLCTPNACTPGGGPGVKGTFTFTPATGDTNNVSYQYRLSNTETWTSLTGSTVNAPITPVSSGTHQIVVRAKDNVGRWGAEQIVDFLVAAGSGPVGRWHFDEADGVAVDSATADGTPRHDVTLSSTATRDDRGRRGLLTHDASGAPLETPVTDRGLVLNGGSHAAADGAVLEPRSSYTVSAWVRLNDVDKSQAILSQDGTDNSSFLLSYQIAEGYTSWFFGVKRENGLYGGEISEQPAQAGVWTHVAGTYDADANRVELFVNGVSIGAEDGIEAAVEPAGRLRFGVVQANGGYYQPFGGSIDEVTTWQRALTGKEIADEARLMTSEALAGVELVADWKAENGGGTTITDTASGYGRPLTLTGGASLAGGEVVLDGVDDAATAAGPLVDDSGSFTVTTAASLDSAKLAAKDIGYTGQVLGQRTADGSAWGFWFQLTGKDTVLNEETLEESVIPVGKWHFGRLNAEGTFSSVVSDEVAAMDSLVRLTGTFDAQSGTISLYLGHNQNGEATAFTAKAGTGDFAIGKGFTSGGWKHHLPGGIAEVRVWAGAMAGPAQVETTVGD
ncbi:LamG-like jellyroll fold domain-containing protein [Streptomyces sp. WMMC940]|uniref:LamG-like jellyroll fold domain-containing protein n=1 Tax=Streptomyces sp. WMMC940 TaxID=3015153 RepID=UPI0022B6CE84|nr:LamG-like jellyroll fold domain-containing protein [Streptomyces sp. WMMC940]MCZ7461595.1 LamG domain protein jellyroll fold domain protein [Streptomyces sp. WMMC940]